MRLPTESYAVVNDNTDAARVGADAGDAIQPKSRRALKKGATVLTPNLGDTVLALEAMAQTSLPARGALVSSCDRVVQRRSSAATVVDAGVSTVHHSALRQAVDITQSKFSRFGLRASIGAVLRYLRSDLACRYAKCDTDRGTAARDRRGAIYLVDEVARHQGRRAQAVVKTQIG